MNSQTQPSDALKQLQDEHGWTEDEARRFLAHAKKMLVNDIVGVPPLTAAERRELALDLKVGDELDEDDGITPSADHVA